MQPLAVDYPPNDVDCNAYPQGSTSFGDDLFAQCSIPPGWYPVVVTQPQFASVSFDYPNGWSYGKPSNPPSVNTPDPFTYRLTDGSQVSNVATVTPLLCVEV